MKLLLVLQEGYGVQSFDVSPNTRQQQCFWVHEGAGLQVADWIQDMASKQLKFSNGEGTLDHPRGRKHHNELSAPMADLLREQD